MVPVIAGLTRNLANPEIACRTDLDRSLSPTVIWCVL